MSLRNIQIPQNLLSELNVPQIVDTTDLLPKNKVKDWNALNPPRKLEALTDNGWHHTGVFLDQGADAKRHAVNHIKSKKNEPTGDGGMPYTFYIKNGQIEQTNDILTFVYAISGKNGHVVSCAVEGRYSPLRDEKTGVIIHPADTLSDDNLRAMIALELTLRQILPNYKRTNGHNFYDQTECPGFSMTKFREAVDDVQNRIAFVNSEKGMEERSYGIANYILYLYNLAQGKDWDGKPASDGQRRWGQTRLLKLEQPVNELKKGG